MINRRRSFFGYSPTASWGKTYRLHTRGFSFPLFGMYPYIVDAKEE